MRAEYSFKKLVCGGEGGCRMTQKEGNTEKREEFC